MDDRYRISDPFNPIVIYLFSTNQSNLLDLKILRSAERRDNNKLPLMIETLHNKWSTKPSLFLYMTYSVIVYKYVQLWMYATIVL